MARTIARTPPRGSLARPGLPSPRGAGRGGRGAAAASRLPQDRHPGGRRDRPRPAGVPGVEDHVAEPRSRATPEGLAGGGQRFFHVGAGKDLVLHARFRSFRDVSSGDFEDPQGHPLLDDRADVGREPVQVEPGGGRTGTCTTSITGMIIMMRCWAGSMAVGVIFCMTNIDSPMRTGVTKKGPSGEVGDPEEGGAPQLDRDLTARGRRRSGRAW